MAVKSLEKTFFLLLLGPKSPVGWSPGHLCLGLGAVVPHSRAVGQLSVVVGRARPGGMESRRTTSFLVLSPPWLPGRHGSRCCCGHVTVFGQSWMPPPWSSLTWPSASRGGRAVLPGASRPSPRRPGWWAQPGIPALGSAGVATQALPQQHRPRRRLECDLCPPPRVETLVPILQQVDGAVRGCHLCGHHVPSHLVGSPHRHRCRSLPPALRDLQEARCAVSGCPGAQVPLLPLRVPSTPSCPSARLEGLCQALCSQGPCSDPPASSLPVG